MKYTAEQLKQMAEVVLEAKNHGDPRYQALLFAVCFIAELSPEDVEQRIRKLAGGMYEV